MFSHRIHFFIFLKQSRTFLQKLDKRPPTAAAPGGEKKKKTKGESVLNMFDEAVARPATAKTKGLLGTR